MGKRRYGGFRKAQSDEVTAEIAPVPLVAMEFGYNIVSKALEGSVADPNNPLFLLSAWGAHFSNWTMIIQLKYHDPLLAAAVAARAFALAIATRETSAPPSLDVLAAAAIYPLKHTATMSPQTLSLMVKNLQSKPDDLSLYDMVEIAIARRAG